jgi:hypothetical protein
MSSAGAFPVKTFPWLGRAKVYAEPEVASGKKCTASSKRRARHGSSLKTCQPYGVEDWTKFSGNSMRSGMMRNGTVYPLQPLVPLTRGTASGLWPTPTTREDYVHSDITLTKSGRRVAKNGGISFSLGLADAVNLWPTPSARDGKGGYIGGRIRNGKPSRDTLDVAVQYTDNRSKTGGNLNPTWVEWLMGYPPGWSALDASETPSSRRSRKRSA